MALKFPSLKKTNCLALTVCGEVLSEATEGSDAFKNKKPMIASTRIDGQGAFVRLGAGGEDGTHLHIDCLAKDHLSKKSYPETNAKKTDIANAVQVFEGAEINARVSALILWPLDKLPESSIINTLSAKQQSGEIAIKLTSGTIEVKGAPIEEVEWTLDEEENQAYISIEGRCKETVDDGYIARRLDWIVEQFNLFVLGKANHATSN